MSGHPISASSLQSTVPGGLPSGLSGLPHRQQVKCGDICELGEFLRQVHCQARPLNPFQETYLYGICEEGFVLTGLMIQIQLL